MCWLWMLVAVMGGTFCGVLITGFSEAARRADERALICSLLETLKRWGTHQERRRPDCRGLRRGTHATRARDMFTGSFFCLRGDWSSSPPRTDDHAIPTVVSPPGDRRVCHRGTRCFTSVRHEGRDPSPLGSDPRWSLGRH
jgi:hypothetical protein